MRPLALESPPPPPPPRQWEEPKKKKKAHSSEWPSPEKARGPGLRFFSERIQHNHKAGFNLRPAKLGLQNPKPSISLSTRRMHAALPGLTRSGRKSGPAALAAAPDLPPPTRARLHVPSLRGPPHPPSLLERPLTWCLELGAKSNLSYAISRAKGFGRGSATGIGL